jgi:hypothetical protein
MRGLNRIRRVCAICVAVIGLTFLVCGCGDDGTGKPSGGTSGALAFTREDGTEVEFPATAEAFVWCGAWEPDAVPVPSLHVWFGTSSPEQPGWWLRAVIGDIEIGEPLAFPNYLVWDQPDSVHIFLFDPPNELATDTEESSGYIVFHRLPCQGGTDVAFSIDAVLGSEYGDTASVAVRGHFTAQVKGREIQ